jgi:hypothetical protein
MTDGGGGMGIGGVPGRVGGAMVSAGGPTGKPSGGSM